MKGPEGSHVGVTIKMINVAKEDVIQAAMWINLGPSNGAEVVGTDMALTLARQIPGMSTDRIIGRGHMSLAPNLEHLSLLPIPNVTLVIL